MNPCNQLATNLQPACNRPGPPGSWMGAKAAAADPDTNQARQLIQQTRYFLQPARQLIQQTRYFLQPARRSERQDQHRQRIRGRICAGAIAQEPTTAAATDPAPRLEKIIIFQTVKGPATIEARRAGAHSRARTREG